MKAPAGWSSDWHPSSARNLFFVLSGFLVSGILFRQFQRDGHIQPGRFLIRRGFKIYPAFWLLIATTLGWFWLTVKPFPVQMVA